MIRPHAPALRLQRPASRACARGLVRAAGAAAGGPRAGAVAELPAQPRPAREFFAGAGADRSCRRAARASCGSTSSPTPAMAAAPRSPSPKPRWRAQLTVRDEQGAQLTLPEADVLLLGGDLAYPGASGPVYQYRFFEPFTMALDPASRFRAGSAGAQKVVAAIPQNHDWFDSASTFCRYFVAQDKGDFLGARTPQRQTYFALKLPHGFWVLGFDWALTGDLDRQQFEAFKALLDHDTRRRHSTGRRPAADLPRALLDARTWRRRARRLPAPLPAPRVAARSTRRPHPHPSGRRPAPLPP